MGAEKHCGIPLRFVLITRDRWHEPKNRSAVVLCLLVNIVVKIMLQRRIQPLSLPGTIDEVVVGIHQNSVAAPIASPVSGLRRHAEVYEGLVANPLPVVFSLVDGCWPRHHGLPRAVTTLWFVGWPCRLDLHAIGAVDGGCAGNSPRISFIVRFHPGQIVEGLCHGLSLGRLAESDAPHGQDQYQVDLLLAFLATLWKCLYVRESATEDAWSWLLMACITHSSSCAGHLLSTNFKA